MEVEQNDHHDVTHESLGTENLSVVMGYKIVGDNIDKNVKSRYAHQERKTVSMHYYHSFGVRDRVSMLGLSEEIPDFRNTPVLSIPVQNILPSAADEQNLMHNLAILTSWMLVDNLKYFNDNYFDVVNRHIEHDFYEEMSQKSKLVSCINNITDPLHNCVVLYIRFH